MQYIDEVDFIEAAGVGVVHQTLKKKYNLGPASEKGLFFLKLFRFLPTVLKRELYYTLFYRGQNIYFSRTLAPNYLKSYKSHIYVHDLNHLICPETMERKTRFLYRLLFSTSVRNATKLYFSTFVGAERFLEVFPFIDRRKIVITPPLLDKKDYSTNGECETHNFVLLIGTFEPRKQYHLLYDIIPHVRPEITFILVGREGWGVERQLSDLLRSFPNRVKIVKNASHDEKIQFLKTTLALLVLSKYEGYCIPAVEAGMFNKPVILWESLIETKEAISGKPSISVHSISQVINELNSLYRK